MGKIFHIIGKSATGKDSIYNIIKQDEALNLKPIVPYTTRPIRQGECEGVEYHFTDSATFSRLRLEGRVIEFRVYHTVHGDWIYYSVDDGSIKLDSDSYIVIGTIESYVDFVRYFGEASLVPVYIEIDDGERLMRALTRERRPENQKYKEMCRRFLADEEDFSEEKIREAGIGDESRFVNDDIDSCACRIRNYIAGKK